MIHPFTNRLARRHFLQAATALSVGFGTRGLFAEALAATPRMTEGPFYPDKLPLDTDNDLLIINESITPAVGEITHLSGRLVDQDGEAIRNAFIEIWQVDNAGVYLHSADNRIRDKKDANFQGYGRYLTDADGRYYFRTIKPVIYTGRCPHIHFAVSTNGQRVLTTQLFIAGEPSNQRDGIFRSLGSEAQQKLVSTDFKPLKNSEIGELQAHWDIALGRTFDEGKKIQGGIGKSEIAGGRGGPGGPGGRPPGGPGGPPPRGPGAPPPRGPRPE